MTRQAKAIDTSATGETSAPATAAALTGKQLAEQAYRAKLTEMGFAPKAAKSAEPVDYHAAGVQAAKTYKANLEVAQAKAALTGDYVLSAAQKAVLTRRANAAKAGK